MRLCIIGNSHIAALKLGWPKGIPAPTFFGSRGNSLRELELRNNALKPQTDMVASHLRLTSGGLSEIDLKAYDAFWLVSIGFAFSNFMAPFKTHRLFEHRAEGMALMSRAVFDLATATPWAEQPVEHLVTLIRSVSRNPIVVIPSPMPGEGIVNDSVIGPMWSGSLPGVLLHRFRELGARVAQKGAILYEQEPATLRSPWLTKQEYVVHSMKRGLDEFSHMNQAYGRIVAESAMRLTG